MEYHYLETTGVLNEAGPEAGWRGRRSQSAWKDRERGGGTPPIWRGKPIPRGLQSRLRNVLPLREAYSGIEGELCDCTAW